MALPRFFQDLLDRLLEAFWDKLKVALSPFAKVFNLIANFWDKLSHLGGKVFALYELILSEIEAWKNFKENFAFRTKVINVKSAIEHIEDFVDQLKAAWSAIKELIQELKGKFETTGNPTEEAEEAMRDIEKSGFKGILEKFPKLAKGFEKVLGFLTLIADALSSIITAVDDLTTIVEALKAIREAVEEGGPLFLQQGNRRKTLRLQDGSSIKIRVGNLHS